MYYIHKYEIEQKYGGPEEGGWWYDSGTLQKDFHPLSFDCVDVAYIKCRELNAAERERAKNEEDYEYTSVLSHHSTHYSYTVTETPYPPEYFPETRPHYE